MAPYILHGNSLKPVNSIKYLGLELSGDINGANISKALYQKQKKNNPKLKNKNKIKKNRCLLLEKPEKSPTSVHIISYKAFMRYHPYFNML